MSSWQQNVYAARVDLEAALDDPEKADGHLYDAMKNIQLAISVREEEEDKPNA
jgi:hypothetical protein